MFFWLWWRLLRPARYIEDVNKVTGSQLECYKYPRGGLPLVLSTRRSGTVINSGVVRLVGVKVIEATPLLWFCITLRGAQCTVCVGCWYRVHIRTWSVGTLHVPCRQSCVRQRGAVLYCGGVGQLSEDNRWGCNDKSISGAVRSTMY